MLAAAREHVVHDLAHSASYVDVPIVPVVPAHGLSRDVQELSNEDLHLLFIQHHVVGVVSSMARHGVLPYVRGVVHQASVVVGLYLVRS